MKIGFIVEDDSEKWAVEAVARQVLPRDVHFHTVRIGGKAGLAGAYVSVVVFLDKGYDHVFVIVDADSTDERVVAEYRAKVESSLREHHLQDRASVIVAVPNTEAWVTAIEADRNESHREFSAALLKLVEVPAAHP